MMKYLATELEIKFLRYYEFENEIAKYIQNKIEELNSISQDIQGFYKIINLLCNTLLFVNMIYYIT